MTMVELLEDDRDKLLDDLESSPQPERASAADRHRDKIITGVFFMRPHHMSFFFFPCFFSFPFPFSRASLPSVPGEISRRLSPS